MINIEAKSKNLKFFPIISNESNKGDHIIYLAAEDIQSDQMNNINKKNLSTQKANNNLNIKEELNNKNKKMLHSYSVDNYSNITNKSLEKLASNLKLLENSKIMDNNFINGIKDSKRKNNLLNALNIYTRYKSLGKMTNINKNIQKNYSSNNLFVNNVIEEDENENS